MTDETITLLKQLRTFHNGTYAKAIDEAIAFAEPKKGKWIQNGNGTYSCSLCHSWIPEEQYYYARFCLYCGADMRGGDGAGMKPECKITIELTEELMDTLKNLREEAVMLTRCKYVLPCGRCDHAMEMCPQETPEEIRIVPNKEC